MSAPLPTFQSLSAALENVTDTSLPHEYYVVANLLKISGILSLMVWLFAQLPQVLENHINESVAGISPTFLACWISGDATNLIGCVLSRALPFQICLAAYYCFIDLILSLQFWYYTRVYPRQKVHHNLLQSPNMMRPVLLRGSTHNHHHSRTNRFEDPTHDLNLARLGSSSRRYRSKRKSFISKILSSSLLSQLFGKARAMPVQPRDSDSSQSSIRAKLQASLASLGPVLSTLKSKVTSVHYNPALLGALCGWISSMLYLLSRSPQIWRNYQNKSTKGISPFLFLFAMIGNSLYTVSIVSDLYLLSKYESHLGHANYNDVLMAQLPFIIGSAGTVLFDFVLLIQFWVYRAEETPMENALFRPKSASPLMQRGHRTQLPSTHFTKPDWYTNNYAFDEPDDYASHDTYAKYGATGHRNERGDRSDRNDRNERGERIDRGERSHGYHGNDRGFGVHERGHERTQLNQMLSLMNLAFTIPPPPHYVSSSSLQSQHIMAGRKKGISGTFSAIARSFSQSLSMMKSPLLSSAHSGSVAASPMAGTSLLPSLVGTYSLVLKKMLNDSKIPFSPSDFLHSEFGRSGLK